MIYRGISQNNEANAVVTNVTHVISRHKMENDKVCLKLFWHDVRFFRLKGSPGPFAHLKDSFKKLGLPLQ